VLVIWVYSPHGLPPIPGEFSQKSLGGDLTSQVEVTTL
jgi:hypothetical protein